MTAKIRQVDGLGEQLRLTDIISVAVVCSTQLDNSRRYYVHWFFLDQRQRSKNTRKKNYFFPRSGAPELPIWPAVIGRLLSIGSSHSTGIPFVGACDGSIVSFCVGMKLEKNKTKFQIKYGRNCERSKQNVQQI